MAEKKSKEQRLKEDFRLFLFVIWKHLNLPEPTPVQYDIAKYLQHGPKRAIIMAFRGVGKSWITSAYVCWLLYRNPQLKIMVVSASKERADAFSIFTKRLIAEVPILQHLQPQHGQRDATISFDVGPATPDHSPSVKSVGITGQLTGSRADVIVGDDIEVPSNSATQVQRDRISELVKEFDAILKPLPTSRVLYLGTPQTELSLYNALAERGYIIRTWPAQYPDEKLREAYGPNLAPWIAERLDRGQAKVGDVVDPKRFGLEDLEERRVSYGRAGYALQFMLDTSLSDAEKYPLKLSDLVVMSLNTEMAPSRVVWAASPDLIVQDLPNQGFTGDRWYRPMWTSQEWHEYKGSVMSIDPAGRGQDQTAYAIIKMLHGQLFLVAAGGFDGGYDDTTLRKLSALAAEHKVNKVIVEANFGDGMFSKLLQPVMQGVHKVGIEEVKHRTQKEVRIIDTLEPVMMQHKLIIDDKVIKDDFRSVSDVKHSLFHQMVRITKERGALIHDDRLDALAIAVNYWVEVMGQDTEKSIDREREKLRDEELKKFLKNCFGIDNQKKGPRWFHTGHGR